MVELERSWAASGWERALWKGTAVERGVWKGERGERVREPARSWEEGRGVSIGWVREGEGGLTLAYPEKDLERDVTMTSETGRRSTLATEPMVSSTTTGKEYLSA